MPSDASGTAAYEWSRANRFLTEWIPLHHPPHPCDTCKPLPAHSSSILGFSWACHFPTPAVPHGPNQDPRTRATTHRAYRHDWSNTVKPARNAPRPAFSLPPLGRFVVDGKTHPLFFFFSSGNLTSEVKANVSKASRNDGRDSSWLCSPPKYRAGANEHQTGNFPLALTIHSPSDSVISMLDTAQD